MLNRFFHLPGWILFLTAALVIVIMCVFSWQSQEMQYQQLLMKISNPGKYAGEIVCVGFLKIRDKRDGVLEAQNHRGENFVLLSDAGVFQTGQTYSVTGKIQKNGAIAVADSQHHPYRRNKYLYSALSVLVAVFLLVRYVRIDRDCRGLKMIGMD